MCCIEACEVIFLNEGNWGKSRYRPSAAGMWTNGVPRRRQECWRMWREDPLEWFFFKIAHSCIFYIKVHRSFHFIFPLWHCDPEQAKASSFFRFLDHTQRRTTVDRASLDEWSTRRRDLYLTTHNTHKRHIHAPDGIRTRNPCRRAVADPRLRPRGHLDLYIVYCNK